MARKSKFLEIDQVKLKKLVLSGWTDAQVADFFDVTEQSLNNYKIKFPSFFESLKEEKIEADKNVEKSLYQRACGYSHEAVKMFVIGGKVVTEKYIEHYPPSEVACIFWLKNRQPDKWRDKQEHEHNINITLSEKLKEARTRIVQPKVSVN